MLHSRLSRLVLALVISVISSDSFAFQVDPQQGGPGAGQRGPGDGNGQGRQGGARQGGGQRGQRAQDGQGGPGGQGGGQGGGQMRFGGGGQGGRGGMGAFTQFQNRYKAEFLRRDVPLYKEQLGFDEGQMTVVETLVNDYDLVFTPAAEESQEKVREAGRRLFQSFMGGDMRETMRSMRETIRQDMEQLEVENGGPLSDEDRRKFMSERMTKWGEEAMAARKATGGDAETKAVLQEIFDEIFQWDTKRAEFKKPVVDGIEATLTADQRAKWAGFQRFLRREKSLENGILSGESTNLFLVMDEAGLSQSSIDGVSKALDDYEIQLDNALVGRDEFMSQSEPKIMKAVISGDTAGATTMIERQFTLRKALRDVNDQSRNAIVGVMSAEDGAKFNKAALAASFRRVFRETRTADAFNKALELPDLTPETRTAVLALQGSYLAELANINERLVNITRKEEPQQRQDEMVRVLAVMDGTASPMTMFGRGMMGGAVTATEDPIGTIMDERGEMGTRYLEQLRAMLTPEQQEELPAGRDGGRNFGNFGTGKIADLPEQFQGAAKTADKNKDGTIDEAEREAMFEAMRSQRDQRPGDAAPPPSPKAP